MLENKIIFQTTEPFFSDKSIRPEPAKIFIPDWYKNLQSYQGETSAITLKMCMPFLDAISMGYIIKMPHEYEINHMQYNPHVKDAPKETWVRSIRTSDHFGISSSKETHSIEQLGGEKGECPFIKQNSYSHDICESHVVHNNIFSKKTHLNLQNLFTFFSKIFYLNIE